LCKITKIEAKMQENIGELIDLHTVIALCRRHQDSMLGRRLALLLQTY
jgi:hypothetical protein